MNLCERFDRLELDNQSISHEHVDLALTDDHVSVAENDSMMRREGDIACPQLDDERIVVHALREAWPKSAMDGESSIDELMCKGIELGRRFNEDWLLRHPLPSAGA